ncbi:hypothetical protein ABPG72_003358 [Tetrahymena utriculariae]
MQVKTNKQINKQQTSNLYEFFFNQFINLFIIVNNFKLQGDINFFNETLINYQQITKIILNQNCQIQFLEQKLFFSLLFKKDEIIQLRKEKRKGKLYYEFIILFVIL